MFVTGPTGSGKSTTLASMIDWINTNRAVHVITIEDPIEYVHEHKRSAVNQREVGEDTDSFADALRSCLREDPDVILVGEMRDLESIRFALTLAETGHVVFGTLHTNDTAQAVDRLIDVFPGDQQPQIRVQLASTLTGVIYQRLVPRVGGGMVAAYEVLYGEHPGAEPGQGGQGQPAAQPDHHRPARRHADPGAVAERAGRSRCRVVRRGCGPVAVPPRREAHLTANSGTRRQGPAAEAAGPLCVSIT